MGFKFNPFTGKFDIDTDTVAAGTATSATITVYSNATAVVASISSLDFNSYFTVTSATTGRANIGFNVSVVSITSAQISDLTETVEDIVFGELTVGSNKVTISYNDTDGTLSIDVDQTNIDHNLLLNYTTTQHFTLNQISITAAQISDLTESVEDIVAGEITVGSAKLTGTYNDTDGTYTIDVGTINLDDLADVTLSNATTGQFLVYTNGAWVNSSVASSSVDTETVQDIVGALLTGTSGILFSYQDVTGVASLVAVPSEIDHNSLLNYTTTQHFTIAQISITAAQISDLTETVEDIVAGEVTAGSSKVTVTYNDTDGTLAIDIDPAQIDHNSLLNYTTTQHFTIAQISITSAQISDLTETVEDIVAGEVTAGSSKITVTYNDTDGTLAIDVDQTQIDHNSLLNYTTTQHFTIAQISITSAQISDLTESVEDIVAGEVTAGSSKVSVTYNDTDGTLAIDVDPSQIDHNALLNYTTTQHFTIAQISITSAQVTDFTETAQDVVFGFVTVGAGLSHNYTDSANFFNLSTTAMLGPLSSTANAVAYFNTTTGNTLAASSVVMITTTGLYLNTTTSKIHFLTSTMNFYAETNNSLSLEAPKVTMLRNDASTGAQFTIRQNGTGDATLGIQISTTQQYIMYADNSDNDSLKLEDVTGADVFSEYNPVTGTYHIGVLGDVTVGDSTLRVTYPTNDRKVDLGKTANYFNEGYLNNLNLKQATLGNAVLIISSTATADDPTETVYQNRVATTNATTTTVHTITIPASTSVAIDAMVIGRRTGGTAGVAEDTYSYKRLATYKNVAGTATIVGTINTLYTAEDTTTADCSFNVSSGNVQLHVVGNANTNITWHATVRTWVVSS